VLLRVHLPLQVNGFLLGEHHEAAGEQEHPHHGQGPDAFFHPIDAESGQEKQVEQQLQSAEK
jgi:hypothetical protein